jgi:ferrous iron transport protein B
MFFAGASGFLGSALSAGLLTGLVALGIAATLLASRLLSATILKGMPSSFTLEMPSYRLPQVGRVLVRSIWDRTLFVLGRAVIVAAPAGIALWLMANITVSGASLLTHTAGFLDPFAHLMGLDGVILLAFILGLPANEIVMPIIVMAYMAQGTLGALPDYGAMQALLLANGWTPVTALCTLVFAVMHWPCSTTLLTIRKEAGGFKWMLLSMLIPTAFGIIACMAINFASKLFL